jgi:hypothetical protein
MGNRFLAGWPTIFGVSRFCRTVGPLHRRAVVVGREWTWIPDCSGMTGKSGHDGNGGLEDEPALRELSAAG